MQSNRAIKVETPEQSLAMLKGVLDNQRRARRKDIVVLNAGRRCTLPAWPATIQAGIDRRAKPSSRRRQGQAGAGAGVYPIAAQGGLMWQDEGTWIALGVSALFIAGGGARHAPGFQENTEGAPPDQREQLSKDE
jgi:hypothetical protein